GALRVDAICTPGVEQIVKECAQKLQPGDIEVYLVKQKQLNAYTFGIRDPKALVIYTPVLDVMNPGELKFIIGHEMGHVALG
ncbi:M48 family metalloprotease, partial [Klebsiella pneumoniae]|uniref:M48 family metalloprotease n=1 Tax=Klebsiella pneumoniae TaxID=573 RepID=UPI002730F160